MRLLRPDSLTTDHPAQTKAVGSNMRPATKAALTPTPATIFELVHQSYSLKSTCVAQKLYDDNVHYNGRFEFSRSFAAPSLDDF